MKITKKNVSLQPTCTWFAITFCGILTSCSGGGGSPADAASDLLEVESAAQSQFYQTPIAVQGKVVNTDGSPVSEAIVRTNATETRSGADGTFRLEGLKRQNVLLEISAAGMRQAVVPLHLYRPLSLAQVNVEPIALAAKDPNTVRLLFSGDVSFGRRFLDPDESTPRGQIPPDRPDALIQSSNPLPGSRSAIDFVRPLLGTVDYRAVNLETPVTDNPKTPHTTKDYAFFTLPGSLPALKEAGIDYVGLGNNHVYDYLEAGLADTLQFVDANGFARSGAGRNANEAFTPWRTTLAGTPYSFLAMTSISGADQSENYLASASKGGAADMRDDAIVRQAISAERTDGRVPIVIAHTGQEYTEQPTPFALSRLRLAAVSGAGLVIGHHPHTAQGFSRVGSTLIAHSLGNFIFDQDRLETMLGLLAQVDMRGDSVQAAEAIPVYLEDYRPRLVGGPLANRLLRRIAEDSRNNGVNVVVHNSRGIVLPQGEQPINEDRELTLPLEIPASGWAVLDLREHLRPGESLATATSAAAGYRLTAGRDRLDHGDFEDQDIDDHSGEALRWDINGTTSFTCLQAPRSGAAALCMQRSSADTQDAVVALRNRVRVLGDIEDRPNKALTLYGWARGNNAGPLTIVSRYYASEGEAIFGEERALTLPGGQFNWRSFAVDLHMPADIVAGSAEVDAGKSNARALRLFLRHMHPSTGSGIASFDDLAIINWEENTTARNVQLATPNVRDFIRVEGAPGSTTVQIVLRRQRPKFATL